MNPADDPHGKLVPDTASSSEEINELKAQVQDMQIQIDILKETINVLKKDLGVDQSTLKNREKVAIIATLRNKYSLPNLLADSFPQKQTVKGSENQNETAAFT